MKLYHGSTVEIEAIDLAMSKPNKDFGKGFYLSDNIHQAMLMAELKADLLGGSPTVNIYEVEDNIFIDDKLKVKTFKDYSKDWADFIYRNRNNTSTEQIHDYDIIIGPIANDRIGLQIRRYMEKEISLEILLENLKYAKGMTIQYFFGTERAIQQLRRIKN